MDSDETRTKSVRSTDAVALKIYRILSRLPVEDRALVLRTVQGSPNVVSERLKVIEQALARYAEETGDSLSKQKYEKWRKQTGDNSIPSATYIVTPFGSWSKAMDALGESPALEHAAFRLRSLGPPPTDEQMLEDVKQCAEDLNLDSLTCTAYHAWARELQQKHLTDRIFAMTSETFARRFGSFANACRMAKVSTPPRSHRPQPPKGIWTEDHVIRALREASVAIGNPNFTMAEYESWRDQRHRESIGGEETAPLIPSYHTIRRIFDSWPMAKARAGLISEGKAIWFNLGQGKRIEAPQVADGLVRAAGRLGVPFSSMKYANWRERELEDPSSIRPSSGHTISKRYGGWTAVQTLVSHAMKQAEPSQALAEALLKMFPDA